MSQGSSHNTSNAKQVSTKKYRRVCGTKPASIILAKHAMDSGVLATKASSAKRTKSLAEFLSHSESRCLTCQWLIDLTKHKWSPNTPRFDSCCFDRICDLSQDEFFRVWWEMRHAGVNEPEIRRRYFDRNASRLAAQPRNEQAHEMDQYVRTCRPDEIHESFWTPDLCLWAQRNLTRADFENEVLYATVFAEKIKHDPEFQSIIVESVKRGKTDLVEHANPETMVVVHDLLMRAGRVCRIEVGPKYLRACLTRVLEGATTTKTERRASKSKKVLEFMSEHDADDRELRKWATYVDLDPVDVRDLPDQFVFDRPQKHGVKWFVSGKFSTVVLVDQHGNEKTVTLREAIDLLVAPRTQSRQRILDREFWLDAQLIRALKRHKRIEHAQLIEWCAKYLNTDETETTKRMDALTQREFVSRDSDIWVYTP